jgi:hypothetical protein
MRRALLIALLAGLMTATLAVPALAGKPPSTPPERTQVYVTSQDVTYDSIVLGTLPPHGRFQQLHVGPDGPYTEFGPGDPGYLGGRWWVDANDNGEMDEGDVYFLCPLLGKGHAS